MSKTKLAITKATWFVLARIEQRVGLVERKLFRALCEQMEFGTLDELMHKAYK